MPNSLRVCSGIKRGCPGYKRVVAGSMLLKIYVGGFLTTNSAFGAEGFDLHELVLGRLVMSFALLRRFEKVDPNGFLRLLLAVIFLSLFRPPFSFLILKAFSHHASCFLIAKADCMLSMINIRHWTTKTYPMEMIDANDDQRLFPFSAYLFLRILYFELLQHLLH